MKRKLICFFPENLYIRLILQYFEVVDVKFQDFEHQEPVSFSKKKKDKNKYSQLVHIWSFPNLNAKCGRPQPTYLFNQAELVTVKQRATALNLNEQAAEGRKSFPERVESKSNLFFLEIRECDLLGFSPPTKSALDRGKTIYTSHEKDGGESWG